MEPRREIIRALRQIVDAVWDHLRGRPNGQMMRRLEA